MMKKFIILLLLALPAIKIAAQNGVGIGTTSPQADLHVLTTNDKFLRLEDSSPLTGDVTIQSADANGTFKKVQTSALRKMQIITLPTTATAISQDETGWQATSVTITLPPGKWDISGSLVLRPSIDLSSKTSVVLTCKMSVSDGGITPSGDILGNKYFLGNYYSPSDYGVMFGNIYINNTGTTDKTYTFIANIKRNIGAETTLSTITFKDFGISTELENQIYARPVFEAP